MPQVVSTAIDRIDYDDATATLYITFRDSGTYAFHGVPRYVVDAFLAARSKGRFFARRIRGQYVQGERLRWSRRSGRHSTRRGTDDDGERTLDPAGGTAEDHADSRGDMVEAA